MSRLQIPIEIGNDLIFVNKASGFSTHSPDAGKIGFVEILQHQLNAQGHAHIHIDKLYVVHRLDKTTTGAMVFATTEKKAQELFQLFQNHQVKKKYLFITDRHPDFSETKVFSTIEKKENRYLNTLTAESSSNARTLFKRVKLNALFELWEALPETGKPHQVRIHAAQAGIPILGDTLYGGKSYPHLCLHSAELEIPGEKKWICSPPPFFERLGLARDSELCGILSALDRRERLYQFLKHKEACLRLSHTDHPKWRIDQYGPIAWVYWYADQDPSQKDLERFEFLEGFIGKKLMLRKMQNRGADPNSQNSWTFQALPEKWTAKENEAQFELRLNSGLSPGLFLDQRENRNWVFQNAANKRVLNLFAYTCGFSVMAALGQAKEVVSVDLSKNFLEWGKENFRLNNLDPAKYEFFAQDTEKFLTGTIKRQRQFDLIICDPPSFSRNNKEVFRLDQNFNELISLCWKCLKPNGTLIFSSNFEKWTEDFFKKKISEALKIPQQNIRLGLTSYDFELPNEQKLMKSFFISK